MKINQRHGFPRLPGGARLTLSRGKFLDGSRKTYFGPGQTPEVGTDEDSYAPATDWPGAGRLLRVPQVVCLSALYQQVDAWADPDAMTAFEDVYLSNGGSATSEFRIVEHAGVEELARMLAVFADVKAQIEMIRPGRTYVTVADYFHIELPDAVWQYKLDGYIPILAPPTLDPAHWFGTDFMHIHIGHIWDGGDHDAVQFSVLGPLVTPLSLADTDEYQSQRAKLVAAFDLFRRHATTLYSADLDWSRVVNDTALELLLADGWTITGNSHTLMDTLNVARLGDIAADLAGYGVTYEGDGASLDAVALVAKIADHYGFDPSTGADLG